MPTTCLMHIFMLKEKPQESESDPSQGAMKINDKNKLLINYSSHTEDISIFHIRSDDTLSGVGSMYYHTVTDIHCYMVYGTPAIRIEHQIAWTHIRFAYFSTRSHSLFS